MPQILRELKHNHPGITIHQVEAGTPEQYRQLADGRLDIAIGHAPHTPPGVMSKLVRLDPLGVLVPDDHRFAGLDAVPVADLAGESLLIGEEAQTPELNQFVVALCRSAGFAPHHLRGHRRELPRRRRPRPAAPLPLLRALLLPHVQPAGHELAAPDRTRHALFLVAAVARGEPSPHIASVIDSARRLADRLGWLEPVVPAT